MSRIRFKSVYIYVVVRCFVASTNDFKKNTLASPPTEHTSHQDFCFLRRESQATPSLLGREVGPKDTYLLICYLLLTK